MNAARPFLILVLSAVWASAASFQNLGFDLANTNTLTAQPGTPLRGTGPTTDLLPGWELFKGSTPQATLGLNLNPLTLGYATLISADQSQYFGFPVEEAYALHLVGSAGNQDPWTLSQRGDIPNDAQLLSYRYSGYPFLLSLNGTPLQPVTQTANSQAFDISRFAGQTVDLTFTALGPAMPTQAGASYIDSITFAVPENSPIALLPLGLLVLWLGRHRGAAHC